MTGPLFADRPGTDVEVVVRATVAVLWPLISDIRLPARFSAEFRDADWLDDARAAGARFRGHNENDVMGRWTTTCTVVECREPLAFGWVVGDPDHPGATWTFEAQPRSGSALLRQRVRLGPGPSGLTVAIADRPDRERTMVAWRLADLRTNMLATVRGIKELAEADDTG